MDKPKVQPSRGNFSVSELGGPCSLYKKSTKVIGSTFLLDERYEIIDTIGSGAYGVVVSARDTKTGELVAIKKIEKAFEHSTFTKRTLRELKIMRLLNHENLIRIKNIQLPKSREEFDEIYVISELMETDLSSIIKSPQPLSDEHVQFFLYQLLRGLKYMHSACILHRDLKPRNLLVNSNCDLKICDFGSAKMAGEELNIPLVVSRPYRAPELALASKDYGTEVDIWSAGCVFIELFTGVPLFLSKNDGEQIIKQVQILGPLPETSPVFTTSKLGQSTLEKINSISRKKPLKDFLEDFPQIDSFVDLLNNMLDYDQNKRLTATQCLSHPFFSNFNSL